MRSKKDPRHKSRVLAVMELYNLFFDKVSHEPANISELNIYKNYSKELLAHLIKGTQENKNKIDEIINKVSTSIKTKDLDHLSLTILRMAIYEGFIDKITPMKVAVDEGIELVRDFGEAKNAKKIAGILGNIFKHFKEKEKDKSTDEKENT